VFAKWVCEASARCRLLTARAKQGSVKPADKTGSCRRGNNRPPRTSRGTFSHHDSWQSSLPSIRQVMPTAQRCSVFCLKLNVVAHDVRPRNDVSCLRPTDWIVHHSASAILPRSARDFDGPCRSPPVVGRLWRSPGLSVDGDIDGRLRRHLQPCHVVEHGLAFE